jgi:hypothetical protein
MTGMNFLFSPWQGGRIYELQSNTNLLSTVWATETAQLTITNGQGLFSITNPAPLGMKFYRLSVRLAP